MHGKVAMSSNRELLDTEQGEREPAPTLALPDNVRTMARQIELLSKQVRELQDELAHARAQLIANEASQLGKTLLGYVLDVLCALLHPQRGNAMVADMVTGTIRSETIETQTMVGPVQMVLERPSLSRAVAGRATSLMTRYESVLWLPILHGSDQAVILCLRRGSHDPFSTHDQEIGEVLGPLVISALQTGHRQFDLPQDSEALRSLGETMSVRIRMGGGRIAAMEREAERLAQTFGLGKAECGSVRMATILHDIGTVDLAEELLYNEGALSPTELEQMHQHPIFGTEIVRQITGMEAIIPLILHHHERWDGTGYPDKLAAGKIPLGARIIAVVDAFHAMTSVRSYRPARSIEDALKELQGCAGTQFDPTVVETFVRQVREEG